jgi:NIPSNAP
MFYLFFAGGRDNARLQHPPRILRGIAAPVYELRLYNVNEGKMDALKARFGDHVDAIFRRHNMKSIGYWSPEDAPDSQNLLIYILEHPSRQEAEKNLAAFQADPEWQKVKAESEANGKLVDHGGACAVPEIISITTSWIRPASQRSSSRVRS